MRIKYHDEWLELACYILYFLLSTFLSLFPFPPILLGSLKEGKSISRRKHIPPAHIQVDSDAARILPEGI